MNFRRLLAALPYLPCAAWVAWSVSLPAEGHGPHHEVANAPEHAAATTTPADGKAPSLVITVAQEQARVGQLVPIHGELRLPGGLNEPTRFTLAMANTEDQVAVLATTINSADGQFVWNHQFYDGDPHAITVTAEPLRAGAFAPVTAAIKVQVEAIAPPTNVTVRTFLFLMLVVGAAMAAGYLAASRLRLHKEQPPLGPI